jgi:hypothetical protein
MQNITSAFCHLSIAIYHLFEKLPLVNAWKLANGNCGFYLEIRGIRHG